jgi:hypothetical protein
MPNYHFLFVEPDLGVEWLFDAARAYFDRFRPTVIVDFAFLQLVPQEFSVVITVIARRDSAASLGVQLAQLRPTALFDPIVHDTPAQAQQVLDMRASSAQPFGAPMAGADSAIPTVTPDLLNTIPTPLVPTQALEGWVTVTPPVPTPTADANATPTPTATPYDPGNPIQPITPTPGSLIGG